jgi:hypothetical protein
VSHYRARSGCTARLWGPGSRFIVTVDRESVDRESVDRESVDMESFVVVNGHCACLTSEYSFERLCLKQ